MLAQSGCNRFPHQLPTFSALSTGPTEHVSSRHRKQYADIWNHSRRSLYRWRNTETEQGKQKSREAARRQTPNLLQVIGFMLLPAHSYTHNLYKSLSHTAPYKLQVTRVFPRAQCLNTWLCHLELRESICFGLRLMTHCNGYQNHASQLHTSVTGSLTSAVITLRYNPILTLRLLLLWYAT